MVQRHPVAPSGGVALGSHVSFCGGLVTARFKNDPRAGLIRHVDLFEMCIVAEPDSTGTVISPLRASGLAWRPSFPFNSFQSVAISGAGKDS